MATHQSQSHEYSNLRVLWHDPNIHSSENDLFYSNHLQPKFLNVYRCATVNEAMNLLQNDVSTTVHYVIVTSGRNGEQLVASSVGGDRRVVGVVVFCKDVEGHSKWARDYSKVWSVTDLPSGVIRTIVDRYNNIPAPRRQELTGGSRVNASQVCEKETRVKTVARSSPNSASSSSSQSRDWESPATRGRFLTEDSTSLPHYSVQVSEASETSNKTPNKER
jgi:hypothetical protein